MKVLTVDLAVFTVFFMSIIGGTDVGVGEEVMVGVEFVVWFWLLLPPVPGRVVCPLSLPPFGDWGMVGGR